MTNLNLDILRSDQCARAFHRMFWGFLVHFLCPTILLGGGHFHLQFLSWIGWLIVASGLSWIKELTPQIKRIRTLAYYLAFLSLIDVRSVERGLKWEIGYLLVPATPTTWNIVGAILGTAESIIVIIFIWQLCGVIMDIASALDNADLRSKADGRRKSYVTFTISASVVGWLILLLRLPWQSFTPLPPMRWQSVTIWLPVFWTLETAWIVVNGLIIGLMKRTEKVCRPVEV